MSGFTAFNGVSQTTTTSFSFGASAGPGFGSNRAGSDSPGGSLVGAPAFGFGGPSGGVLGSASLFGGDSPSPAAANPSFGTLTSQAASAISLPPFPFAFSQTSSAAPSASSPAPSMFGASSLPAHTTSTLSSVTSASSSSLFGASGSAGGVLPGFAGSLGNIGFGFGGSVLSSATGPAATATAAEVVAQPSVSTGFGTSPLIEGSKAATLAFGMTSGMPQFGGSSTTSSTIQPFASQSLFYLSQSSPSASTSASPPGFNSSAIPSFGFGGLSGPASLSAASATKPFSGFSYNSSVTPVTLTASSAFGAAATIPSQAQSSSSTFFGVSTSGYTTAAAAPTSSSSLNISSPSLPSFSLPAFTSARKIPASTSRLGFPLSTATAPASSAGSTPAGSIGFGFSASTPALSLGGFSGTIPAAALHVSPPALGSSSFSPVIPVSNFEGGFSLNSPAKTSAGPTSSASAVIVPSSGLSMASGSSGAFNVSVFPTAGSAAAATQGSTITTAAARAGPSTIVTSTTGAVESLTTTPARTPKPPSEVFGKTVDDIIKEWTHELHERTLKFRKQAESLGEWDRRIIVNRNLLIKLESEIASVVESQHSLERQLELIETHQLEVERSLESMEVGAQKLYKDALPSFLEDDAAATRDMMFEQAEFVERSLERMGGQIKETIQNINSSQGTDLDMAEGASPLDLVVRILNNQLTSLLWIDEKAGELSGRILSFVDHGVLLEKGRRGSRLRGA